MKGDKPFTVKEMTWWVFCFDNSDASNQKKSWRLKMIIDIRKMSQPLSFIRTGNLPPTTN